MNMTPDKITKCAEDLIVPCRLVKGSAAYELEKLNIQAILTRHLATEQESVECASSPSRHHTFNPHDDAPRRCIYCGEHQTTGSKALEEVRQQFNCPPMRDEKLVDELQKRFAGKQPITNEQIAEKWAIESNAHHDQLRQENEQLKKDKERLDWSWHYPKEFRTILASYDFQSFRTATDNAMKGTK